MRMHREIRSTAQLLRLTTQAHDSNGLAQRRKHRADARNKTQIATLKLVDVASIIGIGKRISTEIEHWKARKSGSWRTHFTNTALPPRAMK